MNQLINTSEELNCSIPPEYIKFNNGKYLSYYSLKSNCIPKAIVIFIPGDGGDCYKSDYHNIGNKLLENGFVSYFLDIKNDDLNLKKGSLLSSDKGLLNEITNLINYVKNEDRTIPVYLAGHSSGARIVINYANFNKRSECNGYIFISPYLGDQVKNHSTLSMRKNKNNGKTPSFVFNFLTNGLLCGNAASINDNFTNKNINNDSSEIISRESKNMKSSMLWNSEKQFSMIKKPIGLFIGSKDELFDPLKVAAYKHFINENVILMSHVEIIPDLKHLTILEKIDDYIISFIEKIRLTTSST